MAAHVAVIGGVARQRRWHQRQPRGVMAKQRNAAPAKSVSGGGNKATAGGGAGAFSEEEIAWRNGENWQLNS